MKFHQFTSKVDALRHIEQLLGPEAGPDEVECVADELSDDDLMYRDFDGWHIAANIPERVWYHLVQTAMMRVEQDAGEGLAYDA